MIKKNLSQPESQQKISVGCSTLEPIKGNSLNQGSVTFNSVSLREAEQLNRLDKSKAKTPVPASQASGSQWSVNSKIENISKLTDPKTKISSKITSSNGTSSVWDNAAKVLTQEISPQTLKTPPLANEKMVSLPFEDLHFCLKTVSNLMEENFKKDQEIQSLKAKQFDLEKEIEDFKSLMEVKFSKLEKLVTDQSLKVKQTEAVENTAKVTNLGPSIEKVSEISDLEYDELANIISESKALAQTADSLNKRLLKYHESKIAVSSILSSDTVTESTQKSNIEKNDLAAQTEINTSKEILVKPVEEATTKLIEESTTTSTQQDKPKLPDQVNTIQQESIGNKISHSNISVPSSSITTEPAYPLKKKVALPVSKVLAQKNTTVNKASTVAKQSTVVKEKTSKLYDNKTNSKNIKNSSPLYDVPKAPLSMLKKHLLSSNKTASGQISISKTDSATISSKASQSSSTVCFDAAKRDDITRLFNVTFRERSKVRTGKAYYKILLQEKGSFTRAEIYREKLISMYGADAIMSVVRNRRIISVSTRNESVLLNTFTWMKKLDPDMIAVDYIVFEKPQMVLMAVTTDKIEDIKSDVENCTHKKLDSDPIILSNHKSGYVVLVTFKNHDDYVAAAAESIWIKKFPCEKHEYLSRVPKTGWGSQKDAKLTS